MRGSRTPIAKELEFRAALLEYGFVSGAAKAVGISVQTGYDLAKRAEDDEEFVKARDAMHARVVPEVEARLLRLAGKVEERVEADDPTPQELADIAVNAGLKSFSYQNPKPQYFRGLVDLYGKIVSARKGPELTIPMGGAVVVNVSPTPNAAERIGDAGDGSSG